MGIVRKTIGIVVCLCVWIQCYSQSPSRISISSITPSISTGMDYTPWLNDDTTNLVANVWSSLNNQYVDVKLKLQSKTNVMSLSLYDYTGVFTSTPAYVYAVNGTVKTLIGTFTGPNYMVWDAITLTTPVLADTIVINKYGNCIPEKIKIYGQPATLTTPITGYAVACVGATTSLGNATSGGTWNSSNTGVATITGTTGIVTGVSAGTATISYIAGGLSATTTVTVNPLTNAGSISGTAIVCPGGTTTVSDATSGGTWSSGMPGVAIVSGTGIVTGVSTGTAAISYSVANSCGTVAATRIVTVNPSVAAGTITGAATIAAGSTGTLSNAIAGGTWSSSATGVATVNIAGLLTGVSAGTVTISYTVTNSCGTATATKAVTINPAVLSTPISGTAIVCAGSTTSLSDASAGGIWSSSNTAVATITSTGVLSGVSAGTTNISYSVGGISATKVVTVNPLANAGSITGTATVCPAATTALADITGSGSWSSASPGIATVSSTGVVTGVSTGTANISYSVTNSCGTTAATRTISVNTLPVSGTITGAGTVNAGSTNALINTTAGGSWSSSATGIATIGSTGMVTGVSAGNAIISYTVANSCGTATATRPVTVNPAVSGLSTPITGYPIVCTGNTTSLGNATWGGTWTSSNTAVATINSASAIVTGVSAGTATISYVISGLLATTTITVNPSANPGSITGSTFVCPGSTTALSVASGTSGGTWSSSASGIAAVNSVGTVTGVSTGNATISYSVSNGCGSASATKVVTVNMSPGAGTISGATTISTGATTTLTDGVGGGTWSSSSTSVATVNPAGSVTGIAAGTATISYTVTSTCGSGTATKVVTINPATTGSGGTGGGTGSFVYGMIPVDSNRWYQLNNCSNGLAGLFDGILGTSVLTGYGKILASYDAYYPVLAGEQINIDSVKFYSGTGSYASTPFTLYYIDSLWNKVQIASFVGGVYDSWVGPNPSSPSSFALSVPANNIKYLVINSYGAYPNEMQLYGSYIAPPSASGVPTKTIKLSQEFGVNGFEWNFENSANPSVIDTSLMAAAKSFTGLRHYLDWQKLESTEGGYTFNPSHSGSWNYDTMYAQCKADGIEVLADIKTIPDWMKASYTTANQDNENVPVMSGADFLNPNSYLLQAKVAFQFAARYGYNASVSSSLLSVDGSTRWTGDPANTIKKGMGLIKYIECDNERDKWWKGRKAYQTGREYAANLSAFYDGNKNTMGAGVGVKNADSSMKVVMCGVALATTDYFRGMIDWCKENRGYKPDGSVNLCWDVINYHIYADNGGNVQGAGTRGAAPEVAHTDTIARNFINAAHAYAHDMPVWVTETGYDINQGSVLKAIPIGTKTALQTQADWILRTSLLNARMGVERTFFYEMYDDDTSNPTKFSSSGLINANKNRKPAADYIKQANHLIGDYVYQETISTNPLVDRYELAGQSAYVLVKPSENGSSMSYTLSVGISGNVNVCTPTAGQDTMNVSVVASSGGNITLTVGETPVFVIPGAIPAGHKEPGNNLAKTPGVLEQSNILIYPNPTAGNVNFSIDNELAGAVNIAIYDLNGRLWKRYEFNKSAGKYSDAIDLGNSPGGIYLMEIGQGNEKIVKKIIKVNQ